MRADVVWLVLVVVTVAILGWLARPSPQPATTTPEPASSAAAPRPVAASSRRQTPDPYRDFAAAARAGMKLKSGFNGVAGLLLRLQGERFELLFWDSAGDRILARGRYEVHDRDVRLHPEQGADMPMRLTNWEPYRLDLVEGALPGVADADTLMPLWEERVFKPASP